MDEGKRIFLPPEFRKDLRGKTGIAKGPERCLYFCPLKNWRRVIEEFEESPQIKQVQIDKEGRIRILKEFREYAGLEKEIVIAGCGDHIEIWDRERWEEEKREIEEMGKMVDKRRLQIGRAKRAEKIRTYNFPQDRVTEHRIKKSFHNIEGIMEGKLDPIVKSLQSL